MKASSYFEYSENKEKGFVTQADKENIRLGSSLGGSIPRDAPLLGGAPPSLGTSNPATFLLHITGAINIFTPA